MPVVPEPDHPDRLWLADMQADGGTGRPRMVRTVIADKTTGVYAAQAIAAALFARFRPAA